MHDDERIKEPILLILLSHLYAGTFPSALCSWLQERSWTCTTQPTWARSSACTSSPSFLDCLCTASSCCLSSTSYLPAKTPLYISEDYSRLLSLHWPLRPGNRIFFFFNAFLKKADVAQSDKDISSSFHIFRPVSLQLSHAANHHEVSPGELWGGPSDCSLRAAGGSYH